MFSSLPVHLHHAWLRVDPQYTLGENELKNVITPQQSKQKNKSFNTQISAPALEYSSYREDVQDNN